MHDTSRTASKMVTECLCNNVRTAARCVTQIYDEALRPLNLRASQLAVLAAISVDGSTSISSLAENLGMDRSTLSRNLQPLQQEGLAAVGQEGWRRSRTLKLTRKGEAKLAQAAPLWEKAQRIVRDTLGGTEWNAVQDSLHKLVALR